MSISIKMLECNTQDLRANGSIRIQGELNDVRSDITAKVDASTEFDVDVGKYVYVFSVDRKGKFTLQATDDTGKPLGEKKPYDITIVKQEIRYLFEVT